MTSRCPACARPTSAGQRWCGGCGASLPNPDLGAPPAQERGDTQARPPAEPGATEPEAAAGAASGGPSGAVVPDGRPPLLGRRQVVALGGAALLGVGAGWLLRGPGTGSWIDAGSVDDLLARIALDRWTPVPGFEEPAVHAIVRWDPSVVTGEGLQARLVYANEPVIERTVGLMVLVLRSTHGGCDVAMCNTSGWFEDECFGSRFNGWGEWVSGPAPRGLDRRPSRVVDGHLQVSRTGFTEGSERREMVLRQDAVGPSCF